MKGWSFRLETRAPGALIQGRSQEQAGDDGQPPQPLVHGYHQNGEKNTELPTESIDSPGWIY